jgi:hypothetical protein
MSHHHYYRGPQLTARRPPYVEEVSAAAPPDYEPIGPIYPIVEETSGSATRIIWGIALFVIFATSISYVATTIALNMRYSDWNTQNIKSITGVHPDPATNNVDALAGPGLLFTGTPATHVFSYENTGVITINSLSSSVPARNIDIVGTAPGITVASLLNTITITNGGVLSIIAGTGILVSNPTGDVTISTPALLTINGNAGVANDFLFTATGAGLSISTVGNTVSYSNTGVTSAVAGTGIGVSSATGAVTFSTTAILTANGQAAVANDFQWLASNGLTVATLGNTITYSDTLADATVLADNNALGPLVEYDVAIGFLTPVVANSGWRTGLLVGFPQPFVPGSVDDGVGNVGGTAWTVPAGTGATYTVNADCEILPSAIAVNDLQIVSLAVSLAATTEDPLFLAIIPSGGYQTLDISGGTNANVAAPTNPRRLSVSTTFQAGCSGCLVQPGDALNVHVSMEQTGVLPGPFTFDAYCRVQVAQIR